MNRRYQVVHLMFLIALIFVSADLFSNEVPPKVLEFDYIVKKGDTLWSISKKEFSEGQGAAWQKVYDYNRNEIKDPNLIRPGMKVRVKVGVQGAIGESVQHTWTTQSDGSIVRKVESTVVSLGPGPRKVDMVMSEKMSFVRVHYFDSNGNPVATIELEPENDESLLYRKIWWMEEGPFVHGEAYHVFTDGADLAGNRSAVPSNPSQDVILPKDLDAKVGGNQMGYVLSFKFDRDKPNPNLNAPWAEALIQARKVKEKETK